MPPPAATTTFTNTGASKSALPPTTHSPILPSPIYDHIDAIFSARRLPQLGLHGAVCTSQTQATQIGIHILHLGGNALDACIAIAAALSVTEPMSTGIGGDCFALYYDSQTHQVHGINGSGRSPAELSHAHITDHHATYDKADKSKINGLHYLSVHAITVPGAVAGWCDAYDRWSNKKLTLLQILQPAIDLGRHGFVVGAVTAAMWYAWSSSLRQTEYGCQLLMADKKAEGGYRAPQAGEIMKNVGLANTLQAIGEHGKDAFYTGRVAQTIVDAVQQRKGLLSMSDLKQHTSSWVDPISVQYNGVDVHEIPPNGQGLTVLLAINVIKHLNLLHTYEHNSVQHIHLLIECMRIAFADTRWYVTDSDHSDTNDKHGNIPLKELLSLEYAAERAKLFNPNKATVDVKRGSPVLKSDTVSFVAVDQWGNACSFINSIYYGFGSGVVPDGCGFALQNRGAGFAVDPEHPNHLQGGKRPFHTIIPGMATKDGKLYAPFTVMGGWMQPQGHVQMMVHMTDYKCDSQSAIDQPRFCLDGGDSAGRVALEHGFSDEVINALKQMGHDIVVLSGVERAMFGRAQIIRQLDNGVLAAASDARADGSAAAY